jgi:thiol-disulfide isomerase/thioredoxin
MTMNLKLHKSQAICNWPLKQNLRTFVLAAVMALLVIVSISTHHASAEANNCRNAPPALSNFSPQIPPRAALTYPFFDAQDTGHTISDYKGQGVVLNFWATWCSPCIKEMPDLIHLRELVKEDHITVLALSVDRGGPKKIILFLKKHGLENLDVLIDKKSKMAQKSGVRGIPVTILIDADGIERGRITGIAPWDEPEVVDFVRRCIGPNKS